MSAFVEIGTDPSGAPVRIDIEELLATRLLVQGNSGSGKSHLLRRLLEESASLVQQVVIDPEGDFVTLAEPFGHVVIDGAAYSGGEIARLASRIRQHRASVVLALDGLEIEAQMRCAALFLSTLFDAPREQWFPALVIVDEAQMFAPAVAGDVSDEARRLSLAAMTNLMCRGRKRGLAGIVATQRLAKLAKNVAAEASNFLMGRTFLDIDMARAADLLGMERRQAEQIRDLQRGHFLGLGPAITRRPLSVRIGSVQTGSRAVSHALAPPPDVSGEDLFALIHDDLSADDRGLPGLDIAEATIATPAPAIAADDLMMRIEAGQDNVEDAAPAREDSSAPAPADPEPAIAEILAEMAQEDDCTFQPPAVLFQDFSVRCRMRRVSATGTNLAQFRRRFAAALAGLDDRPGGTDTEILRVAAEVPEDLLAPFLVLARAARDGAPCPDDAQLARAYGTRSPGRIRRLLDHFEKSGLIVVRTDFSGRRSVTIPDLGLTTAPLEA
ncbi:helicase HerA domain-containing protein [Sphingobium sp. CR28]|uniref:helicase HerA domain-containing protein n=1 Tax=Sphingobium sp. CR28 TaxID=3400272 RepID=UPI003FEE92BB